MKPAQKSVEVHQVPIKQLIEMNKQFEIEAVDAQNDKMKAELEFR